MNENGGKKHTNQLNDNKITLCLPQNLSKGG